MEILSSITKTLLCAPCALCGHRADPSIGLCAACFEALPTVGLSCHICGIPLSSAAPLQTAICGECLKRPPPFARTIAPLRFESGVRHLIHRLKFSADFAAVRPLARVMADAVIADVSRDDLPELLLPVPLHPSRLRERGYNQAGELASRLGKLLGIPVGHGHGERLRYTIEQSGLDAAARRRNTRGAFAFSSQLPLHVAIVDDVMTTGSTAREVARAALRAGAKRIEVWCAARAGR